MDDETREVESLSESGLELGDPKSADSAAAPNRDEGVCDPEEEDWFVPSTGMIGPTNKGPNVDPLDDDSDKNGNMFGTAIRMWDGLFIMLRLRGGTSPSGTISCEK